MKLEIKNLVLASIGETASFNIEFFNEKLDEEVTAERIKGTLKLTKLEEQVLADFILTTKNKLTCDRCLSEYEIEIPVRFKQEYLLDRPQGESENMYVDREFKIDVFEPIRQEILTHVPVKKICSEKCQGIKY